MTSVADGSSRNPFALSASVALVNNHDTDTSAAPLVELYAREFGWAVLPLHSVASDGTCECRKPTCSAIGKHPKFERGSLENGVKQATNDVETVLGWLHRFPTANWALGTGIVSGLVVLDIDSYKGGEESFEALQELVGPLPSTVESITGGGGRHLFYGYPDGANLGSKAPLAGFPGLDIRANGGYVVAPPSKHKSGALYRWRPGAHPSETSVAALAGGLRRLIEGEVHRTDVHRTDTSVAGVRRYGDGSRTQAATSLAGALRARGASESMMAAALETFNSEQFDPPWPKAKATAIAASYAKYPPGAASPLRTDDMQSTPLGTQTFAELIEASTVEPPRQVLAGHLTEGDVALVYGYAGVGKSMYALEAAVAIQRGEPFLDQYATMESRVGIIDEESEPRRLGIRLAQIVRARQIEPTDGRLPILSVGAGARLDTPQGVGLIFDWIAENDLSIVVVDTLRRVHGLHENEADDMARIEKAIKALQRRARAELDHALTVILIHHSPKPRADRGNAAETMARGSSDIFAGVDVAFYIRKGQEHGQVVVEQAKSRWSEPMAPYLVEVDGADDGLRLVHRGTVEDITGQHQRAEEVALTMLRENAAPHTKEDLVSRAEAVKVTKRTMERALKALLTRGDLVQGSLGRKRTYSLSETGHLR